MENKSIIIKIGDLHLDHHKVPNQNREGILGMIDAREGEFIIPGEKVHHGDIRGLFLFNGEPLNRNLKKPVLTYKELVQVITEEGSTLGNKHYVQLHMDVQAAGWEIVGCSKGNVAYKKGLDLAFIWLGPNIDFYIWLAGLPADM